MSVRSTYTVIGMTCDHCVAAVTSELTRLPGVHDVDVDLTTGTVTVGRDGLLPLDEVRAAVVVGGYAVGRATGPDSGPAAATVPAHSHAAPGADVGGLAVSASGYTLVADSTRFRAGVAAPFTFRVLGPDGKPLTAYVTAYDKPLHLVVVRRDLTGYQHLGVRLQRGRTAAGRRGLRQPGARGRGDGAVEPVRGDEQP